MMQGMSSNLLFPFLSRKKTSLPVWHALVVFVLLRRCDVIFVSQKRLKNCHTKKHKANVNCREKIGTFVFQSYLLNVYFCTTYLPFNYGDIGAKLLEHITAQNSR